MTLFSELTLLTQTTCKAYRDPVTNVPAPKDLVIGEAAVFLTAGPLLATVPLVRLPLRFSL